jgi:hypothetical protein
LPLARRIKAEGLELAAYSGYTYRGTTALPEPRGYMDLLKLCDPLEDGPFVREKRNLDLLFAARPTSGFWMFRLPSPRGRPFSIPAGAGNSGGS